MIARSHATAILALLFISFFSPLQAAIIYVDQNAPGPTHNGTAWKFAYLNLQDALDVAGTGDRIWVADGNYSPTKDQNGVVTGGQEATFFINKNIQIYGGFSGNETSFADRDLSQYQAVLDGDIGVGGSVLDNTFHVLTFSGVSNSCILNGFIIKNGNANGALTLQRFGAGIFMDGTNGISAPLIVNCKIIQNTALSGGGGAYHYGDGSGSLCAPIYKNCVFANNRASYGAGVYNSGSTFGSVKSSFYNCNFYENNATTQGNALFHGAIFSSVANNRNAMVNCILWDGFATTQDLIRGGGSQTTVSYSIFSLTRMNLANSGFTVFVDGGNNMDVDPRYFDVDGQDNVQGTNDDDYHVRVCSPALDMGTTSGIAPEVDDLEGHKRQHVTIDIGAVEFTGEQDFGVNVPITPNTTLNPSMEFTGIDGWTHYCDCNVLGDEKILLSLAKGIQNIGNVGDLGFNLDLRVGTGYGSNSGLDLSAANYASTGSFFVMHRYWDLNPVQQPTSPITVRFYYTNQDFTDIQTSYPALNIFSDMLFFKTIGGANPHDPNPSVFIPYTYAASASTSTWTDGSFGGFKSAEYQVSSFSGGGGGSGSGVSNNIFPVSLLSFSAKHREGDTYVNWHTAQEVNSAYFEVQRSQNGVDFVPIGEESAAGNTDEIVAYEFIDRRVDEKVHFYRLRAVDLDGSYTYSQQVEVRLDSEDQISVYPNPFSQKIVLQLSSQEKDTRFQLFNIQGQQVWDSGWRQAQNGILSIDIPAHIPLGFYHYKVYGQLGQLAQGKTLKE